MSAETEINETVSFSRGDVVAIETRILDTKDGLVAELSVVHYGGEIEMFDLVGTKDCNPEDLIAEAGKVVDGVCTTNEWVVDRPATTRLILE